jgi:hypothetical protein
LRNRAEKGGFLCVLCVLRVFPDTEGKCRLQKRVLIKLNKLNKGLPRCAVAV